LEHYYKKNLLFSTEKYTLMQAATNSPPKSSRICGEPARGRAALQGNFRLAEFCLVRSIIAWQNFAALGKIRSSDNVMQNSSPRKFVGSFYHWNRAGRIGSTAFFICGLDNFPSLIYNIYMVSTQQSEWLITRGEQGESVR
jgi:hypothetical protein